MDLRNEGEGVKSTRRPEILLTVNSSAVSTPLLENERRIEPGSPSETLFHINRYLGIVSSRFSITLLTSPRVSDDDHINIRVFAYLFVGVETVKYFTVRDCYILLFAKASS